MGQDSDFDDDTVAFVRTAISSVCALELLILLRRERQRCFGADQLVRELRSSQLAVAQAIEHLTKSGLIEETRGPATATSRSPRNSTPFATDWNPFTHANR